MVIKMKQKRTINILWTGGLDSTCRVAQLSQMDNIIIQPYYIIDPGRGSIKYEINAMKNIAAIIRNHPKTTAELKDTILVKLNDIKKVPEITKSYNIFKEKYRLGGQYDFLARYAKQENIALEVGLECSPRSKAYITVTSESKDLLEEKEVDELLINKETSSRDLINVFENLRIGKRIWTMSKLEEVEYMKSIGLGNIISLTHFCHAPIFGLTCGQCNPCKDALNEGMAWRVSKLGRALGLLRKIFYYAPKKIIRKVISFFCK